MVKVRLTRMGRKKAPFYRLVAADSRFPRDGRFIEILGYYNPLRDPAEVKIDSQKVFKWLKNGAQATEAARNVLRMAGVWKTWIDIKEGRLSLEEVMSEDDNNEDEEEVAETEEN